MSQNFITKFFNSFKNSDSIESTNINHGIKTDTSVSLKATEKLVENISDKIDPKIIAAISAAISAILSSESDKKAPYPGFLVRKIRRLY